MEIIFSGMRTEHLEQVYAIEQASYQAPWSRHIFSSEVDNGFAHYIVAAVSGRVIGYAGMWLIFDEAQVTNIAVHPDYRGNHIGRSLLMELIRRAVLNGAVKITLEVRPSNGVARHLYTTLGFVEEGLRKKYYTDNNEDAIIMWWYAENVGAARPEELK